VVKHHGRSVPAQSLDAVHDRMQPVRMMGQPPAGPHSAQTVARAVDAGQELDGHGNAVQPSVPSVMHWHVLQSTGSAIPVVPAA
jgi:hypothetical protein